MNSFTFRGISFILQVKDIYLHPDPFSIQNGLLTPSLKMKRPQLKDYFKPQIEDLYRHLDWSDWASILILFSLESDTKTRRRIEACLRRIYTKKSSNIYLFRDIFIISFSFSWLHIYIYSDARKNKKRKKHRLDY